MDEAALLSLYEAAFKERKDCIIKALHLRLFVYLQNFKALTADECKRIEKRDLSVEKRAAEIFKVVRDKHDLSAYIGLSKTVALSNSENLALFPFIADMWWLQIQHCDTKRDDNAPLEPDESTLSLLWLTTARSDSDVVVKVLDENDWEMSLIEEKTIEGCHCATYAPRKPHVSHLDIHYFL